MGEPESRLSTRFKTFAQVLFFVVVWLLADCMAHLLGIHTTAGVIGLALVAVALFTGLLPIRLIAGGAQWLLAEMLLFFMPSLLAVTDYGELIASKGWILLLVLMLGCLIVMAGTAWVVDAVVGFERRRHERQNTSGNQS